MLRVHCIIGRPEDTIARPYQTRMWVLVSPPTPSTPLPKAKTTHSHHSYNQVLTCCGAWVLPQVCKGAGKMKALPVSAPLLRRTSGIQGIGHLTSDRRGLGAMLGVVELQGGMGGIA